MRGEQHERQLAVQARTDVRPAPNLAVGPLDGIVRMDAFSAFRQEACVRQRLGASLAYGLGGCLRLRACPPNCRRCAVPSFRWLYRTPGRAYC